MPPELINVKTSDGLRLHGLQYTSARNPAIGAILMHGVGGNFYTRPLPRTAEALADAGYSCVAVNTRGHDWVAGGGRSKSFIGSSYELIEEASLDIEAFVGYMKGRGFEKIILAGHSLGGAKALYYPTEKASRAVAAVVCISPAPLSRRSMTRRLAGFAEKYSLAQKLVSEGKPDGLIRMRSQSGWTSETLYAAKTFVDKYGQSPEYDGTTLIKRLATPVLVTVGSRETRLLEYARSLSTASGCTLEVIEGVGHFYDDKEPLLAEKIAAWLDRTL